MLERSKKPLYYCRRLTHDESGETFAAPVLRYLNYKSLGGEMMLETIGEVNSKNLVAKTPLGGDAYTEGDRCYVNMKPPQKADQLCSDADYRVSSVLPGTAVTEIVFERTASSHEESP